MALITYEDIKRAADANGMTVEDTLTTIDPSPTDPRRLFLLMKDLKAMIGTG